MSLNGTNSLSEEPGELMTKGNIFRHTIYGSEGLALLICNGVIVITVLRHQALREAKEFIIIASAAFGEVIYGLGFISAGLWRISVWLSRMENMSVTRYYCLLKPHMIFWNLEPRSIMMAVVSVDRLMAVTIPLKYITLTDRYGWKLCGGSYMLSVINSLILFLISWFSSDPNTATKICWTQSARTAFVETTILQQDMFFTIGSLVLYALIPVFYYRNVSKLSNQSMGSQKEKLKFQLKLTKTVGIDCLATLLLVIVPLIVSTISISLWPETYVISSVIAAITFNIDPLLNLFIYVKNMKELRKGCKALFINKTLPGNLENW